MSEREEMLSSPPRKKKEKLRHLIFTGENVTIPLCGYTTVGEIATKGIRKCTCEACLKLVEAVCQVESYKDALELVSAQDMSEQEEVAFSVEEGEDKRKYILGHNREDFWEDVRRHLNSGV